MNTTRRRTLAPFLALFLAACASTPPVDTTLPGRDISMPVTPAKISAKERVEGADALSWETLTPLDRAVLAVEENGDAAARGKYFVLDEDGDPVARAVIEGCDVLYRLDGPEEGDDPARLGVWVDFTVTDPVTGEYRAGTFFWPFWEESTSRESAGSPATAVGSPAIAAGSPATAAGLLLSLDDDFIDVWEDYFPLFDRYGARVTFFVTGDLTEEAHARFCAEALRRGHDIGYHSLNHRDLRGVSQDTLLAEAVTAAAAPRSAGVPLTSFAFPYGFSDDASRELLGAYYGLLRGYGTTFRLYRPEEVRAGYIISTAIDNTVLPGDAVFERRVTRMLRTLKFLGSGLVFPVTTHDISAVAAYGITPARLEFFLAAARRLDLVFYRYSDFTPSR